MPVPALVAAGALAVAMGTDTCGDLCGEAEESQHVSKYRVSSSAAASANEPIVDEKNMKDGEEKHPRSIRSIESPAAVSLKHIHTTARLSQRLSGTSTIGDGFLNGDFASGKVCDIELPGNQRCFVIAFQKPWLVVGMLRAIAFYDCSTATQIHVCDFSSDMVSALHFLTPTTLAVGGLDGSVAIYGINADILESQGPTLLFQFKVTHCQQVRALAAGWYGKLQPTLVLAVGDKSGTLTLASFQMVGTTSLQQIGMVEVVREATGILSLEIHEETIAYSTRDGQVVVRRLTRNHVGVVDLMDEVVWSCQRHGPVRCLRMNDDSLVFGGYDKTLVLVDVKEWAIVREISMNGTVNTIEMDPRFLAVGCRDKSLTLFDTSTYYPVKRIHTPGWVTSICWDRHSANSVSLMLRPHPSFISILDLTPTKIDVEIRSQSGTVCSSWSPDGRFWARGIGSQIVFQEIRGGIFDVSKVQLKEPVISVAYSPVSPLLELAAVDESGCLTLIQQTNDLILVVSETMVERDLKSLAWSPDGLKIATGGKAKQLYVYEKTGKIFQRTKSIEFQGRIWDIQFVPKDNPLSAYELAVALGDYTTALLDTQYETVLQVPRSRTCRCVAFHPTEPILVIGDGSSTIAVVDLIEEEIAQEVSVGGRLNCVAFSPVGDYLVAGSDDNNFQMMETVNYRCVQEVPFENFAVAASFSPNGRFLALGSVDSYILIRLGPFLSVDLIPLRDYRRDPTPDTSFIETLHRSCNAPSLLQRLLLTGGPENLKAVADLLQDHPTSIYTFDRSTSNGFFDTVMALQKPNLMKLAVSLLVNGTVDLDGDSSLLTTDLPEKGKRILTETLEKFSPLLVVDILRSMVFVKLPFADERYVDEDRRFEKGSDTLSDLWGERKLSRPVVRVKKVGSRKIELERGVARTPAVLPLPGLGEMDFLAALLSQAPAEVFDNNAMAMVLRILWNDHIKRFFFLDFAIFFLYYLSWIALVEILATKSTWQHPKPIGKEVGMGLVVSFFNTVFALKELAQSRVGRRSAYWRSVWNYFDISAVCCVYVYVADVVLTFLPNDGYIPLGVCTTMALTVKFLSYLRGFGDTGWLISVLIANFNDVRGFLIILFSILMGFAVSFRSIYAATGDESFASLRRSFLSTFELTITGSYEPELLFAAQYTALAVVLFILAITCVLVVALNALISILADSFARVQAKAVANRRRELASLIVEYMMLLPPWKRRRIERNTKWFHSLLEVDADGDLLVKTSDWEGGLNALRRDVQQLSQDNAAATQRLTQTLKNEVESDIQNLRRELVSILEDVAEDITVLKKKQSGAMINGKNVARAVKAVRSVGQRGKALLEGANINK